MFFWCHIRHLNPLKTHPEIITNAEEKMANYLDYEAIEFRICKKDYCKIERKKKFFFINVFCYENNSVYPVYVPNEKFENGMDLLMVADKNKSHYVNIKDFNRFMCSKTKNKNKIHFCAGYVINYLM